MQVKVNEKPRQVEQGATLLALRDRLKPAADVVIVNGAPVTDDRPLAEGDAVVFVRRGEVPPAEELEALLVARHSPGVHAAVKAACVGVAGLGGLGSAVAVALARLGVGRLVLADFDVVEPSNLNRQQYFVDQIGLYKTDALAANLQRINPYVTVETHTVVLDAGLLPEVFSAVDVLVEALDAAEAKAMCAESFATAYPDRPLVMASGLAGYEPSNTVRTRRVGRNIYVVGDLVTAAAPGVGLMAPRVGVAAHHQANAVLRLLLGADAVGEDGP